MSYKDNKGLSKLEMDIKLLIDGEVEKESHLVRDALSVYFEYKDDGPIINVINDNPGILEIAKRNISRQNYLDYKHPYKRPTPEEVRKRGLDKGGAKLGFINHYGNVFSLAWSAFLQLVIILGQIGRGKTTLLKHIIISALNEANRSWPIFISDPIRREYRDLTNKFKKLVIIPSALMRMNPFQVDKHGNIKTVIRDFVDCYFSISIWGPISKAIIEERLEELYVKNGCYEGSNKWPTFKELYIELVSWKETVKTFGIADIVEKAIFRCGEFAKCHIFDCREGLSVEYFLSHDTVMESDDLANDIKTFLLSFIIHKIFRHFVRMGVFSKTLKILFILEEASGIHRSPGEKEWDIIPSAIENSKYMRKLGIGRADCMQSPDMVHHTIDSNAVTQIAFPLTSGHDIKYLEESFGLGEEQVKYIHQMKPFGEAIVKTAPYPAPFVMRVPSLEIGENPPQDIFEQRMAQHWSVINGLIVPAEKEIIHVQPPEQLPDVQTNAIMFEMTYLPFYTKTDVAKLNKYSKRQKEESVTWLLKHDYFKQQKFPTTKTNHPTYYVPQQKALKLVGKTGYGSKGGYEHSLYCYLVMNWAATHGYNYKLEGRVAGFDKSIDVLVDTADLILAYEITLHMANLVENIVQDIDCQVDIVVIVVRNQNDLKRAKQIVESEPILEEYLDRISFQLAYEFNQV